MPARMIGQGLDMGRPSLLEASAEKKAGTVVAAFSCRSSRVAIEFSVISLKQSRLQLVVR